MELNELSGWMEKDIATYVLTHSRLTPVDLVLELRFLLNGLY